MATVPYATIIMTAKSAIEITVNDSRYTAEVEPRLSLADFLRDHLGLTGTHVGCEQGICGSCTILLDGESVRSCLLLAVQAHGATHANAPDHEGCAEREGDAGKLGRRIGVNQAAPDGATVADGHMTDLPDRLGE